ncbi:MAG: hypothetical protein ACI3Z5_05145 [Paludibacteraceae bacterium]
MEKQRNRFVTFWLWFGIIVNAIVPLLSIVSYQSMTNLGVLGMQLTNAGVDLTPFRDAITPHVLIWQVVAAISGICMIVFYSQILKWRKIGFWGCVMTAVIVAIINVVMMNLIKQDYALVGLLYNFNLNPITQVIATSLSLLILWAILQIKKNGVSCWKQLE